MGAITGTPEKVPPGRYRSTSRIEAFVYLLLGLDAAVGFWLEHGRWSVTIFTGERLKGEH